MADQNSSSFFNNNTSVEDYLNTGVLLPGDISSPYVSSGSFFYRTSDADKREEEEQDQQLLGAITKYGLSAGALYAVKKILENQKVQRVLRDNITFSMIQQSMSGLSIDAKDIYTKGNVTLGGIVFNATRFIEEMSPFKIARTFQLSHVIAPMLTKEATFDFTPTDVLAQKRYLNNLISKYNPVDHIRSADLRRGLRYEDGRLIGGDGRTLLEHARLTATSFDIDKTLDPRTSFFNRVFHKYLHLEGISEEGIQDIVKLGPNYSAAKFSVMAGDNQVDIDKKVIQSVSRLYFETGLNTVSRPLEPLIEMLATGGPEDSKTLRRASRILSLNTERHTGSIADMTKSFVRGTLGKLGMIAVGATFANEGVQALSPNSSPFSEGILQGLATTYLNARIQVAEMYSDNFSEYREQQEYVAPKSTSLLTLSAFPLSGMMTGGTVAYFERVGRTATQGYTRATIDSSNVDYAVEAVSDAISPEARHRLGGILGPVSKARRYAIRGGIIGAALGLPFLPGALIGESSDDIKNEYLGKQEVAIRNNRYWFCLAPDVRVVTRKGVKRADSILVGDYLSDRNGNFNQVLDISVRVTEEEELFNIKTEFNDYLKTELTGNHEILTHEGFKRAEDISLSDYLAHPLPSYNTSPSLLYSPEEEYSYGYVHAWVIQSALMSDYCSNREIIIPIQDDDILHSHIPTTKHLFESIVVSSDRHYQAYSRYFDRVLRRVIQKDNNRYVSKSSIDLSQFTIDFIKGYLDYFLNNLIINRGAASFIDTRELHTTLEIQRYLTLIGVYTKVDYDYGNYYLEINEYSRVFTEEDILYVPVVSISKRVYSDYVYDYTVQDKHEYLVNSYIVHNSGSNEYEGDGIKYFTRNWYQRLMADNKNEILYGDESTKDALNPILHPFSYLNNPYQLEEMHEHDMPYPVWGMDVSVGGWAGKIFERTAGQIIKPDRFNPELFEQTEASSPSFLATLFSGEKPRRTLSTSYTDSGTLSGEGTEELPYELRATGLFSIFSEADEFRSTEKMSRTDTSLIRDGMMTPPRAFEYDPIMESAQYSLNSLGDFAGLKGWVGSLVWGDAGIASSDMTNQLARSGEVTTLSRELDSMNLGGMFGVADPVRRLIPMSVDTLYDRSNPIQNEVTPTWLPSSYTGYYINFKRGAFWNKVENGYDRLPGIGYEKFNTELEGLNPEDYPDIYKLDILSDVAFGSDQYYHYKDVLEQANSRGELSEEEQDKLATIYEQSQRRTQRKNFYEYKSGEDWDNVSIWGRIQGKLWEGITHNAELPSESLTFFRPAGKLLHQRTAIEDYESSQIYGTDQAIWTSPYSSFIKPALNKTAHVAEDFIPEEIQEKRSVDRYFDYLEYYKQMRIYRENYDRNPSLANYALSKANKTVVGSVASGLDTEDELISSYAALNREEKAYYTAFVNADRSDRGRISSMLDDNLSEMYQMLWRRKDAGRDPEAIQSIVAQEEQELISDNQDLYDTYIRSNSASKGISFSAYQKEEEAARYIEATTGMPSDEFIGWDSRIDVNDIKLRTLMIGKEDLRKYGFWEDDERQLREQIAVLNEDEVVDDLSRIKLDARNRLNVEMRAKDMFHRIGYKVDQMNVSNVGNNGFTLNINQSEHEYL